MNTVEQIFNQISDITAAKLTGYTKVAYAVRPEKNDFRSISKAFGVRHGPANSSPSAQGVYTLDHTFEIILVDRIVERDNDDNLQASFNELYNQADSLLSTFFIGRLNLTDIVFSVTDPAYQAPQVLKNDAALLIVSFKVKYRNSTAVNN